MGNEFPNQPGGAHLRTIAMPRDANASGDIFGGWTLSQMDLAGGTFAANHSGKRVVTVRIEAVEFLTPVYIGDDVSVFCWLGSFFRVIALLINNRSKSPVSAHEGSRA